MNTAVLNALKQVSEAKALVLKNITGNILHDDEKRILGDIFINLQEQENVLINCALQEMVDKINSSNAGLKDLIQQMDTESQNLSEISDKIKKVSGVLSTLTEIITKAISAGLAG